MTRYLLALATAMLAACAQQQPVPQQESSEPSEPVQEQFVPPLHVNFTPFSTTLLTGRCGENECNSMGEYFSWHAKVSFDIDKKGKLKVSDHQELSLTEDDDPADDQKCGIKGGPGNQRTTWFPYTGIFVRGGQLKSVRDKSGSRQELVPLTPIEQGLMMVVGTSARKIEYAYVPCVGKYRVPAGHRLSGFFPRDAVIAVKPAKGPIVKLALPEPTEPYVLLRFRSGARVPVPMRPIMLTIDLIEHRLVVHYQSTFPVLPPLRKIELRAILPDQGPDKDETAEHFRERTEATLRHLRHCPIGYKPMEGCATPNQNPDPRMFSR